MGNELPILRAVIASDSQNRVEISIPGVRFLRQTVADPVLMLELRDQLRYR